MLSFEWSWVAYQKGNVSNLKKITFYGRHLQSTSQHSINDTFTVAAVNVNQTKPTSFAYSF